MNGCFSLIVLDPGRQMSLFTLGEMNRYLLGARRKHFLRSLKIALFLLCLAKPTWLHAETLSGTVEDPSGAVIVGARIEISGANLAQPVVLVSDGQGRFSSSDLKPAIYSVRVTRDGFEPSSGRKLPFLAKLLPLPIPILSTESFAISGPERPFAWTISLCRWTPQPSSFKKGQ